MAPLAPIPYGNPSHRLGGTLQNHGGDAKDHIARLVLSTPSASTRNDGPIATSFCPPHRAALDLAQSGCCQFHSSIDPSLLSLSGHWISAAKIAKGAPWVCLGLKTLMISPVFDPSTIQEIQPRVFEQMARLEHLEVLRLWDPKPRDDFEPGLFQRTVDLRLTSGLGKLSTLRRLRYIAFNYSHQRMGEQEMDWILEHWTGLEMVRGRLDALDDVVGHGLMQRLRDRGIDVDVNTGVGKELYEDVD
ncbi:hypothetical protein BGX34_005520 [Mortierella sp. NVP85]|nr:hypothetical protein BGX34_005520 [Mortierella sp. NVP85]